MQMIEVDFLRKHFPTWNQGEQTVTDGCFGRLEGGEAAIQLGHVSNLSNFIGDLKRIQTEPP